MEANVTSQSVERQTVSHSLNSQTGASGYRSSEPQPKAAKIPNFHEAEGRSHQFLTVCG